MAYLYSLYDALVMGATLATKQDLELHRLATKQDLELLRQELAGAISELKQEIGTQTLRMTVRFGSMLFLGLGLTIAVLRLWSG